MHGNANSGEVKAQRTEHERGIYLWPTGAAPDRLLHHMDECLLRLCMDQDGSIGLRQSLHRLRNQRVRREAGS